MTIWPEDVPPLPAATPCDRPVALLLRHAERPPIAPGEVGGDLSLTAAGLARATALGRLLRGRLHGLHTSPVRRCRETAEALRAGSSLSLIDDRMLGDPGIFVLDAERAWENWCRLGYDGVLAHLAREDAALPGMASPSTGARRLAAHLLRCLDDTPGLRLFVTHDAILVPTLAGLVGHELDRPNYPEYLECAALWHENGAQHLAYRTLSIELLAQHDRPGHIEQ